MAATKFGFLNQPNNTVQGYTLQGGAAADFSLLGVVLPQTSSTFNASPGILVACLNADGTLDTTSTVAVTIAIGTNPTSGSVISGTLVKNAVGGIACFNDLAITLGGAGYTLTATGSLTTATSNAFTLASLARVNQATFSGTCTAGTGIGKAVGPYRFRPGRGVKGVNITITSTAASDAASIVAAAPGQSAASFDVTTNAPSLFPANLGTPLAALVVPVSISLDSSALGGPCDLYVYPTTQTGVITVVFRRLETSSGY
jgi:hypothetical protein